MEKVIQYIATLHIKNILFALIFAVGCQNVELKELPKSITLIGPNGEKINTRLAISSQEQAQGLSGVADKDFEDDDAMLFFNLEDGQRAFWMPDTYFNLSIIFLDKELKIIDIDPDVQHHPGWGNHDDIPRAKVVFARHILEMKATSPIAKKIKVGEKFSLQQYSLEQIEQGIRQGR